MNEAQDSKLPLIPLQIPQIDYRQIGLNNRGSLELGSGLSGRAMTVRIPPNNEFAVLKLPTASAHSNGDLRREADIIKYLMERGVTDEICILLGESPDMKNNPYIFKEFAQGISLEFASKHMDRGSMRKLVGQLCIGMFEGLARLHDAGVVVADCKAEDVMNTDKRGHPGEVVTKIIELGNAFKMNDISQTLSGSQSGDCQRFFNLVLEKALNLSPIPLSANAAGSWLIRHLSFLQRDPNLLRVCQNIVDDLNTKTVNYPNARTMLPDVCLVIQKSFLEENTPLTRTTEQSEWLSLLQEQGYLVSLAAIDPTMFRKQTREVLQTRPGSNTTEAQAAYKEFVRITLDQQYSNFTRITGKGRKPAEPWENEVALYLQNGQLGRRRLDQLAKEYFGADDPISLPSLAFSAMCRLAIMQIGSLQAAEFISRVPSEQRNLVEQWGASLRQNIERIQTQLRGM